MFFYDKDMERMMQLKKQEIMREMEKAKKRILEELNCVKRSVHTDFCNLLADYNRIDFQMKQLLKDYETEIKKVTAGYSDLIALKFAEYNDMVVDKVEQLEILEREIELYFSTKQAELEAMRAEIQQLIELAEQYNQAIQNGATKEELANLRTELVEMINNVDVSEDLEQLRTDINNHLTENYYTISQLNEIFARLETLAKTPSDWNAAEGEPGHVLNRTHWAEGDVTLYEMDGEWDSETSCFYYNNAIPLQEGETYIVYWDGVPYTCIAFAYYDGISIGDPTVEDPEWEQSSGEPFIFYGSSNHTTVVASDFETNHTFTVQAGAEKIHKLDDKFLPNPDWNESDESKGTFIKNKPEIAQSDWNESDESKAAFIKNRTHYGLTETVGTEFVLGDCLDKHVDTTASGHVNIRRLNGDFSSWNETTTLHVVYADWYECTLKGHVRNYAIYEPIKSLHTGLRVDSYYPVVNGLIFGDIDLSTKDLTETNRIAIYLDPRDSNWYVAICHNKPSEKKLSIISDTRSTVEKTIDCAYMGENGSLGKVLTHNGTVARWETMPGASFYQSELVEMYSGNLTVKNTHSQGAVMNDVAVDFASFDPNTEYYGDVGYGCVKLLYESETILTDPLSYSDVVTLNNGQMSVNVKGGLKNCAPVDYDTNGVSFTLYCVKTSKRVTPIVIYSPSGKAFNITVSDDGVLSATPATTE